MVSFRAGVIIDTGHAPFIKPVTHLIPLTLSKQTGTYHEPVEHIALRNESLNDLKNRGFRRFGKIRNVMYVSYYLSDFHWTVTTLRSCGKLQRPSAVYIIKY